VRGNRVLRLVTCVLRGPEPVYRWGGTGGGGKMGRKGMGGGVKKAATAQGNKPVEYKSGDDKARPENWGNGGVAFCTEMSGVFLPSSQKPSAHRKKGNRKRHDIGKGCVSVRRGTCQKIPRVTLDGGQSQEMGKERCGGNKARERAEKRVPSQQAHARVQ